MGKYFSEQRIPGLLPLKGRCEWYLGEGHLSGTSALLTDDVFFGPDLPGYRC